MLIPLHGKISVNLLGSHGYEVRSLMSISDIFTGLAILVSLLALWETLKKNIQVKNLNKLKEEYFFHRNDALTKDMVDTIFKRP